MKLKLDKQDMYYLEDILLSAYYGLALTESPTEAHPNLRKILDIVQDKIYGPIEYVEDDE